MNRRNFVKNLGFAAGMSSIPAYAFSKSAKAVKGAPDKKIRKSLDMLTDSIEACENVARICLSHCNALLGSGDTMLADCQFAVVTMLESCTAAKNVAYANMYRMDATSKKNLKMIVETCQSFCEHCLKECDKHADHHDECKACAEACKKCIEHCKKTIAMLK